MNAVFGTLATIASLTIITFGLPRQIIKNYRRKSVEGLDPLLVCSVLCTYTLWGLYGWTKPDWFIAISQTPGALVALILFYQFIRYRRPGRPN